MLLLASNGKSTNHGNNYGANGSASSGCAVGAVVSQKFSSCTSPVGYGGLAKPPAMSSVGEHSGADSPQMVRSLMDRFVNTREVDQARPGTSTPRAANSRQSAPDIRLNFK